MSSKIKFFDINISNCIKGIAAIFIMFGHYFDGYPWYITMFFAGNLWVGVFFFFSGYGLKYSLINKENYLDGFLVKKFKQIYLPFFFAETVHTVSSAVISKTFNVYDILLSCLGFRLSNGSLWYVVELLAIYLIFYICKKYLKNQKFDWIWIPLYIAFLVFAVLKDIGTWWYISTFTFLIGYYYNSLNNILHRFETDRLIKSLTILLFAAVYSLTKYFSYTQTGIGPIPYTYIVTFLNLISAPVFVLFCITLCSFASENIRISNIFEALGSISYEIYLWHMCVFMMVKLLDINLSLQIIISFILTIFISSLLNLEKIIIIFKAKKSIKSQKT
ncbi:MAG: acyltransferase [Eubacterium sp.]|nr:acyltransferase [Eubacterium sp.]